MTSPAKGKLSSSSSTSNHTCSVRVGAQLPKLDQVDGFAVV